MAENTVEKMTPEQIKARLASIPEWSEMHDEIHRTFQFKDFVQAMAFVNAVAREAEAMNHHPDILIRYDKVTLRLSTHDAGGVTDKDFILAEKADGLAQP